MNVYSVLGRDDERDAIESLPDVAAAAVADVAIATGTDGRESDSAFGSEPAGAGSTSRETIRDSGRADDDRRTPRAIAAKRSETLASARDAFAPPAGGDSGERSHDPLIKSQLLCH